MKFKKYLLLLFLPLIFLVGCSKDNSLDKVSKNLNAYTIEIEYNDDHTLDVEQVIKYTNRTENSLESVLFHLYPRSFREDSKCSIISTLNYSKCYYNGASFGNMEINELKVDGTATDIKITGNDEDILEVKMLDNLTPNEDVNIYIKYSVTLPNINHRFGYGEDTINLGNFYPIACVYQDGDWVIDSYHYNGDPFYSEISNYNVSLTCNSNLKLASTGNLNKTTSNENTNTYNISAKAVRDFAIVLSDKFEIVSGNIDGVKVNYYYYKNKYPSECLQAGLDGVRTFNSLFGKYPYATLNIVESNFVHGGMEYPNLVLISDAVDIQSDYINVIVHETAHQWWYGLVGNDEFSYGWLDEGLTEYSTILFYNENPSYNVNTSELIKNTTNSFSTFVDVYTKVFGEADTTMNRKLNEYTNESEYVYIAYVKGLLIFDSLEEILGHDKFIRCLQYYFEQNKFGISTPDKLIEAFEKSSKTELSSFFESWINGKVKIIAIN
ncbi:MAG: M1 family metallopeptidase [Christensenellales bacterium]